MILRYSLLFTALIGVALGSQNPFLHNFPSTGGVYDIRGAYSLPLRDPGVAPCALSQLVPPHPEEASAHPQLALPNAPGGPTASVSYVPVQIATAAPSAPASAALPHLGPRPNGHMMAQSSPAAEAQMAAAQLAAAPIAQSPLMPLVRLPPAMMAAQEYANSQHLPKAEAPADPDAEWKRALEAQRARALIDAQRQIQRHRQLEAAAQQQLSMGSAALGGSQAPAAAPALGPVSAPSAPQPSPTTPSLSQLSARQLEEYARNLRAQLAQEQTPSPAEASRPADPMGPPADSFGSAPSAPHSGQLIGTGQIPVGTGQISSAGRPRPLHVAPQPPLASVPAATVAATNPPLPVVGDTQSPTPFPKVSIPPPLNPLPLATRVPTIPPKLTHDINYCNRQLFDDQKLASLHLKHSDYFVYNTSCSGIFFQCAIGQTFVLKCPDVEGQAFDPTISSCNFKNSVRFCPQYDHVLHCTIRESCTTDQFACCALPQQCIPYSRRCDGHRDCSDGDDENNCPSCARNEFACVKSGTCIPARKRCDGKPDDCADGSNLDEIGCSKNETCWGKFVCDGVDTLAMNGHSTCIDFEKRCDNVRDCPGGEDELNCRQADAGYLSCENQKQQVRKEQWCDGREDCADGSDEKYCF